MIKLQNKKNNDKIYINPQRIFEVDITLQKELAPDGFMNTHTVYTIFSHADDTCFCRLSSKDFDTNPLQAWLDAATSQFAMNGKMLY